MARKVLALIAGILVFVVLTTLVQVANAFIFGMPNQQTMADPERMMAWVSGLPAGAFAILLLSYVVGSFASGWVMAMIARWDSFVLPVIVGLIGTAGWAYTITQLPHPIWVTVLGFLCYIPFAILGYRIGTPKAA